MKGSLTEADISLRDGRIVHLRAARESDEKALLQAFERVGQESRYMRFMRVVGEPNVARLRELLAALPEHGQGIVAVTSSDEVVGSALYLLGRDPTTCEFSTTVVDGYGGLGLGRALMTALIAAAKQRGLREMEGFVLSKNKPMLKLAERLGFTISPDPEDPTVQICHRPLADAGMAAS